MGRARHDRAPRNSSNKAIASHRPNSVAS
jgi:hypothetical protein